MDVPVGDSREVPEDLERALARVLDRPAAERAAGFATLRAEHPGHAELLERCEQAAAALTHTEDGPSKRTQIGPYDRAGRRVAWRLALYDARVRRGREGEAYRREGREERAGPRPAPECFHLPFS